MSGFGPGTNTGHGHVWPRPDGARMRCGGPPICRECSADAARVAREAAAQAPALRWEPDPDWEDAFDGFCGAEIVARAVSGANGWPWDVSAGGDHDAARGIAPTLDAAKAAAQDAWAAGLVARGGA